MTDSSSLANQQQPGDGGGGIRLPPGLRGPTNLTQIFSVLRAAAPVQAGLGRLPGLSAGRARRHHAGQSQLLLTSLQLTQKFALKFFTLVYLTTAETCDICT